MGTPPFQNPLAILGPPDRHFGFLRLFVFAGGEWVTLALAGWYLNLKIQKKIQTTNLLPKIILGPTYFGPYIYLDLHVFGPNSFLKIFFLTFDVLQTTILFPPNFYSNQHFFVLVTFFNFC